MHSMTSQARREAEPISHDQLAAEVKGIYAGLSMVEAKCINIDAGLAADPQTQLSLEQLQALIALHRTLLYEHHDFLMATQHPSATPAFWGLAKKYSMPARMWKHGIHAFLEVLRYRGSESQDCMLAFINLAYDMMELLYETVPTFADTWIECLGDLARYRMAVEEEREAYVLWGEAAVRWYTMASERHPHPAIGRLSHHLGILEKPNLRKLHLYVKSLTSMIPFPNARESLTTLYGPNVQSKRSLQSIKSSAEANMVLFHAQIFSASDADARDSSWEAPAIIKGKGNNRSPIFRPDPLTSESSYFARPCTNFPEEEVKEECDKSQDWKGTKVTKDRKTRKPTQTIPSSSTALAGYLTKLFKILSAPGVCSCFSLIILIPTAIAAETGERLTLESWSSSEAKVPHLHQGDNRVEEWIWHAADLIRPLIPVIAAIAGAAHIVYTMKCSIAKLEKLEERKKLNIVWNLGCGTAAGFWLFQQLYDTVTVATVTACLLGLWLGGVYLTSFYRLAPCNLRDSYLTGTLLGGGVVTFISAALIVAATPGELGTTPMKRTIIQAIDLGPFVLNIVAGRPYEVRQLPKANDERARSLEEGSASDQRTEDRAQQTNRTWPRHRSGSGGRDRHHDFDGLVDSQDAHLRRRNEGFALPPRVRNDGFVNAL